MKIHFSDEELMVLAAGMRAYSFRTAKYRPHMEAVVKSIIHKAEKEIRERARRREYGSDTEERAECV